MKSKKNLFLCLVALGLGLGVVKSAWADEFEAGFDAGVSLTLDAVLSEGSLETSTSVIEIITLEHTKCGTVSGSGNSWSCSNASACPGKEVCAPSGANGKLELLGYDGYSDRPSTKKKAAKQCICLDPAKAFTPDKKEKPTVTPPVEGPTSKPTGGSESRPTSRPTGGANNNGADSQPTSRPAGK